MSVDKFGRVATAAMHTPHELLLPKVALAHTSDGNIDIENLKICNVKAPTSNTDVANKAYVDQQVKDFNTNIEQHGNDIQALAMHMNDVKAELHKTKFPSFENRLQKMEEFIARNPPTAGKHMATKKYVDDVIVISKDFLRKEVKNEIANLNNTLHTITQTYVTLQTQVTNLTHTSQQNFTTVVNDIKREMANLHTEIQNTVSVINIPSTTINNLKNEITIRDTEIKKEVYDLLQKVIELQDQVLKPMNQRLKALESNQH